MPSNLITINYSEELEWVIPDSQMEGILLLIDKVGDRHYPISSCISPSPCSQTDFQPLPAREVAYIYHGPQFQ